MINQLERLADQSLRDNLPSQRINSSQPRSQLARGGSQTPGRDTVQYTDGCWTKLDWEIQSPTIPVLSTLCCPRCRVGGATPEESGWAGVSTYWCSLVCSQAKPLACTHCQTSKYNLLTLVSLQGLLKQHLQRQFEQRALQQMSRQTKTPSFD